MESLSASLLRSLRLGLWRAKQKHRQRAREIEVEARELARLEAIAHQLADEFERERERRRIVQR